MATNVADVRRSSSVSLASIAGPSLVLSGSLIMVSQLLIWPLRRGGIHAALTSPLYEPCMVGYLLAMSILVIGVFAMHARQARAAGTFGLVALCAVAFGTTDMAGNVWFDTFVAPWLEAQIPAALSVPRNGTLVAGALLSYVSMTVGWILFGLACLRARVVPRPLAAALLPAALLAFNPIPPYSIGFGLVIVALGIWLVRHPATNSMTDVN